MRKKWISGFMCLAVISSLLWGCGTLNNNQKGLGSQIKEDTTEEITADEEPIEISMFIASPEYEGAIDKLIEAYQKENPNIIIHYETTQNDYPTMLKAKLNAGECPDIFSSTSGKEIDTYLSYSYDLSEQPLADAMTDAVKAVMTSGESVYGLSIKGNYFGIIYNQELFDKVGITEFPHTYEELVAASRKLSAAGYTPFTTGFAEWWVYKHCFQSFLDAAGNGNVEELVQNLASGKAKLSEYPEIYEDYFNFVDLAVKYSKEKPLETNLHTEMETFASGKVGMMLGQGAWVEAELRDMNPDIQLGFEGYPVNADPANCKIIAGSDQALRVNRDSTVLQPTLDFLNWWYTSEYGKSWFKDIAQVIPPIKEAEAPDMEIIEQGAMLEKTEGIAPLSITYATDSFQQAFGKIMQSYVAGTIDKDTACKQIETKWIEIDGPEN